MTKPYKAPETYSPVGAIPEDERAAAKKRNERRDEDDIRAAESSKVEHKGGTGLTLAEGEAAAGGNRDQ